MSPFRTSSWRDIARDRFVSLLGSSGQLERARKATARRGLIVLTLHRIVPDDLCAEVRSPRGMVLRETLFHRLVEYLAERTTSVSAMQLDEPKAHASRPRVLLTFDDGWADNAQIAWPALKSAGLPMCIFVTTGLAGREAPFWPERLIGVLRTAAGAGALREAQQRLCALAGTRRSPRDAVAPANAIPPDLAHFPGRAVDWCKEMPAEVLTSWIAESEQWAAHLACDTPQEAVDYSERLLTWTAMRQLLSEGVAFGSHTVSHPILTARSIPEIAWELRESRMQLRRELTDTPLIAYPNGNADACVAEEARRAGYRYGFRNTAGIWSGTTDPLLIPRVNLWDGKLTDRHGRFSTEHLEYSVFCKALQAA